MRLKYRNPAYTLPPHLKITASDKQKKGLKSSKIINYLVYTRLYRHGFNKCKIKVFTTRTNTQITIILTI